jgi:hypothetical protein
MEDTIVCERCGTAVPVSRMKEVMYEQDRRRVTQQLCSSCLDVVMAGSDQVRGIVGERKAAAVHVTPPPT